MSADRLAEAVRALREETAEPSDAGQFTRARIMASVREGRRRRAGWVTVLVPIAAVLVVGSALATVSGGVPAMVQRLMGRTEPVPTEPAPADAPTPKPALTPAADAAPVTRTDVSAVGPDDLEVEAPPRPVAVASTPRAAVSAPPSPASAPVESTDLTLYRAAHHKHFQQADYTGAIAAYDRYLSEAPRGRFVLEASYNRALCLIRVGRAGEATTALRPFAEGRHGTYRKDEARQLLDAMQTRDAASGP